MKKLYLGTNLKMYKNISQTRDYLIRLRDLTTDLAGSIDLFVIPSFTTLPVAQEVLQGSHIRWGAQNMHWEETGQFTGEISPLMLREVGVTIAEIGHSERRHIFGEDDNALRKKVKSSIDHGMTALLCIGETAKEKADGISDEALSIQIKRGLKNIVPDDGDNVWIAYEPVWAIGINGIPADPEYVELRHMAIRNVCKLILPEIHIPILYGGSVNPQNAKELIDLRDVDGLFIGRAAWEAEKFNILIREIISAAYINSA